MAAAKKRQARVKDGIRGLDAVGILGDVEVTKSWTNVSATDAKKLLEFEYKGQKPIEFRDAPSDEGAAEDEGAEAKAAETGG